MSKKRYRPEEIIDKLREADVPIGQGKTVADKCPSGGRPISQRLDRPDQI